jgi:hypothetical protein
MIRRHLILRAFIPTIAAAALAASPAAAMPTRDAGWHEMSTPQKVQLPVRVDADAHAATIRGIGVRLLAERTCE